MNDKPFYTHLTQGWDFYKLTMARYHLHYYPNVIVGFGFTNRSQIQLPYHLDMGRLQEELANLRSLQMTPGEVQYLSGLCGKSSKNLFDDEILNPLGTLQLPEIHAENWHGYLRIEAEDTWWRATFTETPVLSIVNQLYFEQLAKESGKTKAEIYEEGLRRLGMKIRRLQEWPSLKFSDFGTRRHFSWEWQQLVYSILWDAFSQEERFLGTSNVWLAMQYAQHPAYSSATGELIERFPIGTEAHERYMVIAALNDDTDKQLRGSVKIALQQWEDLYGPDLLVALSDTFGTESFLEDFEEFAERWSGLRPDSGEPVDRGKLIVAFYQRLKLDLMWKTIVFGDGNTDHTMTELFYQFQNRIWTVFGWGTNLMNDMGFKPISIVMKAIWCRWDHETRKRWTVKLSDNPLKAMSESPEAIERYKRVFNYQEKPAIPVIY